MSIVVFVLMSFLMILVLSGVDLFGLMSVFLFILVLMAMLFFGVRLDVFVDVIVVVGVVYENDVVDRGIHIVSDVDVQCVTIFMLLLVFGLVFVLMLVLMLMLLLMLLL